MAHGPHHIWKKIPQLQQILREHKEEIFHFDVTVNVCGRESEQNFALC